MLNAICNVLKEAYKRNWISTKDGNASFRRKCEPILYITPSGVKKEQLTSDMMIKLEFGKAQDTSPWLSMKRVNDKSQILIKELNPSGELAFHSLLQQTIEENRVVLHLHPTYTVAAMYAGIDLVELSKEFPELNRYTKVGQSVPMVEPISEDLAKACINAFKLEKTTGKIDCDIIGLDRHGIIAIANDAWEAFSHVERLEHICQIAIVSGKHLHTRTN